MFSHFWAVQTSEKNFLNFLILGKSRFKKKFYNTVFSLDSVTIIRVTQHEIYYIV